jgi:signal transduction histidine kinase
VAHHVSLIAVRAATAPYQLPDLSPAARAALDEIAEQARTALAELRTVLGVLRNPDGSAPHAPQPGLADLPQLVDRMRAGGTGVTLTIGGAARPVGDAVGLCCYRVVQEALTNAARHAPGQPVEIAVEYATDSVVVAARNSADVRPAAEGTGLGLLGMRERVAALGGTLQIRQDPGTFSLRAVIPVDQP